MLLNKTNFIVSKKALEVLKMVLVTLNNFKQQSNFV